MENRTGGNLIPAGYLCGGLSLLIFPIGLGIAGLVIGIINLTKGRLFHGISQIVLACICAMLGMIWGYNVGLGSL